MVSVTREEFDVLWAIDEDMRGSKDIHMYTGIAEDRVKEILVRLGKKRLVEYSAGEHWEAKIADSGLVQKVFEQHSDWVP